MKKDVECDLCLSPTKNGTLCKRTAACKIGCKFFCWQHVLKYGGTYNVEKQKCKSKLKICDKRTVKFPCKKKFTVFFNKEEYEDYRKLKKSKKTGEKKEVRKKFVGTKPKKINKRVTKKVHFDE